MVRNGNNLNTLALNPFAAQWEGPHKTAIWSDSFNQSFSAHHYTQGGVLRLTAFRTAQARSVNTKSKSECFTRATSKVAATAKPETLKLLTGAAHKATDNKVPELTLILKPFSTTKMFTWCNYNKRCCIVDCIYMLQRLGGSHSGIAEDSNILGWVLCRWVSSSMLSNNRIAFIFRALHHKKNKVRGYLTNDAASHPRIPER